MSEWLMEVDCNSTGYAYAGSNPARPNRNHSKINPFLSDEKEKVDTDYTSPKEYLSRMDKEIVQSCTTSVEMAQQEIQNSVKNVQLQEKMTSFTAFLSNMDISEDNFFILINKLKNYNYLSENGRLFRNQIISLFKVNEHLINSSSLS